MRPLHFLALAPPNVAPALAGQASESLRPYVEHLRAAVAAAVKREARSRCRFRPAPVERPLQLEALDTLVELAADDVAYRVVGFSGPIPSMPLFVGAQGRPVTPTRVESHGTSLTVWLPTPIEPSEPVYWAMQSCELERASVGWPNALVARSEDGTERRILERIELDGRRRVVVEGTAPCRLFAADAEVASRTLAPSDGATRLVAQRFSVAFAGESELSVSEAPEAPTLRADNGVRYRWTDRRRRRGVRIQLLEPDQIDAESSVDPRVAFCIDGVREIRATKGGRGYKVLRASAENYTLELDQLPPEGSTLFVPGNVGGLKRQLSAIHRLRDAPLPHHRELLRLTEDPGHARWQPFRPAHVERWYLLTDDRFDGTTEQREFVAKALATPDFAFLEGPPGSGKTFAICELVLQLVARGLRVLLCSTTHVAVDNVLERLLGRFPEIEAVRLGHADRVDPLIRTSQLDERVEALTDAWRAAGTLADESEAARLEAAKATILASANLTCSTTTGILSHPLATRDGAPPQFDVLVLDEASKTTFQEFLVPASLARRWVVVGDVRQLPPFTEARDLEASLEDISEGERRFSSHAQRACLLAFRLSREEAGAGRARWLVCEDAPVLDALEAELDARSARGDRAIDAVRLVEHPKRPRHVSLTDVTTHAPSSIPVLGAEWVLVARDDLARVEGALPADLLRLRTTADEAAMFRHAHWLERAGAFAQTIPAGRRRHAHARDLQEAEQEFHAEASWANQNSWRLGRSHQLASARNARAHDRIQRELDALAPASEPWVGAAVDAVRDVGVRSVIEALRVRRVRHRVRRRSALTEAIPADVWADRAVLLTHQHRMHPTLSALPRDLSYEGTALRDANTLEGREARLGWTFLTKAPSRRVWIDVQGVELRGVNAREVDAVERVLRAFTRKAPAPRKDGRPWEIACLAFYHAQELAIRDMLRRLTGKRGGETRFELPNATVVCGTVDRFQGREADLVVLSLRNTRRPGHLDSPNRLNVALTRARFGLVVVGHRTYFANACPSEELNEFATRTPVLDPGALE